MVSASVVTMSLNGRNKEAGIRLTLSVWNADQAQTIQRLFASPNLGASNVQENLRKLGIMILMAVPMIRHLRGFAEKAR
jgi:hypothetical protein